LENNTAVIYYRFMVFCHERLLHNFHFVGKTVIMTVTYDEYEPFVVERCIFKIFMSAVDLDDSSTVTDEDDFSLSKPVITAKV